MLNITQYEQLEKAYGKTLREIASDSDSWKRFLDSAGYTYRQSFKNQVAMYSQKPGMKAVLTEKRWEDMNRAVKSGTTGVRIFDDKSPNHISYVFDYADTVPGSPPPGPRPWTVHKNKTGIALHNLLKRTGEKNLDNYVQNRVRMIVDSEVDPGAEPAVRAALQRCLEQSAMYVTCVRLHTQDAQGIGQGASMVLVSVKDDLYTITSAELKKCGYRVLKLDLRNVFCSCHFNLLYRVNIEIDAWRKESDAKQKAVHYATAERYAKVIASAIIGNTGSVNSGDSSEYFNETARGLITGLVLLVSQYGQDGERHIVSVFNLIVELAGADNPEKGNTVQKSRLAAMLEGVTDRRIKGYISTTTSADIRTTLNIVSSALSKLLKFVDAELEQLICTHDNDLDAERFIERPTAIFLIAPDENETRHFLASLFVRFLTDDLIALAERQGGHCPRPFYYFLDEFGNFPAIPGVTSLFSAIRSRGGRILVAVQSYSQFLLKYDKNVTEIIKDNCQILLNTFVSPSAQDTATSISKMLGDETILTGSTSKSDGKTTSSHQLMGRPLLSPAQMVRIQRDTWIVEKAGYAPMKTHLEGYWKYLSLAPQEQDAAGENDYLEIKLLSTESLRQALGSASTRPHTPPAATREPRRKLGASRREAAALYPGKFNP